MGKLILMRIYLQTTNTNLLQGLIGLWELPQLEFLQKKQAVNYCSNFLQKLNGNLPLEEA